ncbi:DEAD-box ATP-dependent RNA helicase [Trifolium repens]|nr:DEAD-box ATP-dependent RNA helicase [Trifolium repens]
MPKLNSQTKLNSSEIAETPWSDIPKLDLLIVINYDVPRVPQDYIHRVSGRGGFALNLVTQVGIALSTTDDG